jgi:hypothetical protein
MNSRELKFLADLIDAKRLAWPPEARQLRSVGMFGDQDECWRLLAAFPSSFQFFSDSGFAFAVAEGFDLSG